MNCDCTSNTIYHILGGVRFGAGPKNPPVKVEKCLTTGAGFTMTEAKHFIKTLQLDAPTENKLVKHESRR